MTTIKWQGALSSRDADLAAPAAGVSLYVDGSRVRPAADSSGDDARESLSSSTQTRLVGGLENALSTALSRLSQRLDALSAGTQAGAAPEAAPGAAGESPASKPTHYASKGFDSNAPTTLAPGSYTLDYLLGQAASGESGSVSFQVSSGDTWGDVLSRMARVLGSSSPSLISRLVPARRTWTLPDSAGGGTGQTEALGLELLPNTDAGKWALRLSGADAASDALLASLGLNATAQPGVNTGAAQSGQTAASASGASGVSSSASQVALRQAGIINAATGLADALGEVLAAYNEVGDLLEKNQESLAPGVAEKWSGLGADRADALRNIGVERAGQSLWLSEESFLTALFARPQEVRDALFGPQGLLPALAGAASPALEGNDAGGGVADWIAASAKDREGETGSAQFRRVLAARTEVEVEKASQLLDLYDTGSDTALDFFSVGAAGGLLQRKG